MNAQSSAVRQSSLTLIRSFGIKSSNGIAAAKETNSLRTYQHGIISASFIRRLTKVVREGKRPVERSGPVDEIDRLSNNKHRYSIDAERLNCLLKGIVFMIKYYKMDVKKYEESRGYKYNGDEGASYNIRYDGNHYYIINYADQCFEPYQILDGEKTPDLSFCEEISREEVKDIVTEYMKNTEKRFRKLLEVI